MSTNENLKRLQGGKSRQQRIFRAIFNNQLGRWGTVPDPLLIHLPSLVGGNEGGAEIVANDMEEGVDRHHAEHGQEVPHLQHDVLLPVAGLPVTDGDGVDCSADFE